MPPDALKLEQVCPDPRQSDFGLAHRWLKTVPYEGLAFGDGQRTAVELPPGTAIGDVTEYGMQGVQAMSGTLYRCDAFMLEQDDFLPGTRLTFSGALFASGPGPTWTVTP